MLVLVLLMMVMFMMMMTIYTKLLVHRHLAIAEQEALGITPRTFTMEE